ncbi:Peptidase S53 propeptide, partial [mine drainage metagenome]
STGPNSTYAGLDAALAYILNPNASTPGLANVSVITNSWGGSDTNDSSWYTNLQVAQARGITVLASSGDSGSNPNSSKWVGTSTEFPSSMAYGAFGVTAVGGTTVTLHSTVGTADYLHLKSQIAWNISAADISDGGPAGSSGGISSVFSEPSWQLNTSANGTIQGAGRATPDIAAVANNTLITISINGHRYDATNATTGGVYDSTWGTSIASPLTAGIIAEIDHVLATQGDAPLGFLNPDLYTLANEEYAALASTPTTG